MRVGRQLGLAGAVAMSASVARIRRLRLDFIGDFFATRGSAPNCLSCSSLPATTLRHRSSLDKFREVELANQNALTEKALADFLFDEGKDAGFRENNAQFEIPDFLQWVINFAVNTINTEHF